jgi:hypothetical protein
MTSLKIIGTSHISFRNGKLRSTHPVKLIYSQSSIVVCSKANFSKNLIFGNLPLSNSDISFARNLLFFSLGSFSSEEMYFYETAFDSDTHFQFEWDFPQVKISCLFVSGNVEVEMIPELLSSSLSITANGYANVFLPKKNMEIISIFLSEYAIISPEKNTFVKYFTASVSGYGKICSGIFCSNAVLKVRENGFVKISRTTNFVLSRITSENGEVLIQNKSSTL